MKKSFNFFCHVFNLKADNNQRWLLMSSILRGLIMTYCMPILQKTIITDLPAEWIAAQGIIACVFGLLSGVIYRGEVRNQAIRWFRTMLVIESVCGFTLAMYLAINGWNALVFAVVSLIYTSLITEFVCNCTKTFKSILWNGKKREEFDITKNNVGSIVAILGLVFALLAMPSLKTGLLLWGLACIIDDIGWYIVYSKNKKMILEESSSISENKIDEKTLESLEKEIDDDFNVQEKDSKEF